MSASISKCRVVKYLGNQEILNSAWQTERGSSPRVGETLAIFWGEIPTIGVAIQQRHQECHILPGSMGKMPGKFPFSCVSYKNILVEKTTEANILQI